MAKKGGNDETLREELKVLLQAQTEWTEEVERLSEQRDVMMQKAQGSEAALDSERQAIDDLERECHSLELRCCNAKEEESGSESLAANISAELQKISSAPAKTNGKGGKSGKGKAASGRMSTNDSDVVRMQEELNELRRQVEQEQQRQNQEEQQEAKERATRARVDEQCMLLRALLDMVTGTGKLSKTSAVQLLQQLWKKGPEIPEDHPDAWSLLAQQAERHGAARRELLECCNQELRRRQRSAYELLDEEFLPLLLGALKGEGIVEAFERPDAACAQRLSSELLKR
ncbi:unnamed protein product [Cladocopium goreaui]|uniref:Uncharacterized protein n=1 Tax=Cladocopium goreaui TaxID=2562237 RepID=A0A9P1BVD8_9DINO|nr:unnamed protein product [Cladocopium goreaui]